MTRRRPTRWLAPLAIVAVAGVGLGIVSSRGSNGGDGASTGTTTAPRTTRTRSEPRPPAKRTYVVRSGDTLSSISIETGVAVVRLQELNPDIDVQALQPGQRLKLRS